MRQPKISVYIVSHNYGHFLEDCIESVLRQSVDNWELFIIDDKSSDNTAEVMNLYKGDPRIRLFSTEGIGLPAVCNLALREAAGDYIIRLDADDIFDENILLVLGNYLDRHENIALVFPDYYLIDENGEIFGHERRRKIYVENHQLDLPANGACSMIRVKVLREFGGYREDLGAQDGFDLWSRLIKRHTCANVNLPLFYYRRHGSNLTNNKRHILAARRRIKYDSIANDLEKYRPITAVIPCRKRYDFLPDIWKTDLIGKSLLQHSVDACLASNVIDHVIVTSDNPEAEEALEMYQDRRLNFFLRDARDTIRSRKIVVTLEKIISSIDPEHSGVTIISYVQSPFVTTNTLEEAIFTLIMNRADSSIGVEKIEHPLYRRTPYGLEPINPPGQFSTDFDAVFCESNIVIASNNKNLMVGSLIGPSVVHFILPPEEVLFVNSPLKLKIARAMGEEFWNLE